MYTALQCTLTERNSSVFGLKLSTNSYNLPKPTLRQTLYFASQLLYIYVYVYVFIYMHTYTQLYYDAELFRQFICKLESKERNIFSDYSHDKLLFIM